MTKTELASMVAEYVEVPVMTEAVYQVTADIPFVDADLVRLLGPALDDVRHHQAEKAADCLLVLLDGDRIIVRGYKNTPRINAVEEIPSRVEEFKKPAKTAAKKKAKK